MIGPYVLACHHAHISSLIGLCNAGAVGLYVPGGTAVLPSSTLMMAVPAQIAGCKTIVMATPPRSDGQVCVSQTQHLH